MFKHNILAISKLITEDIKVNNGLIPEEEEDYEQEESEEVYNSYSGYLPASDNFKGFSLKLNQILEDYVRYVHRDGKGLMNNNSLDRMKLSDEEEFELIDLLDFGLQQPPEIRGLGSLPHGAIFAFTEEGEIRHKRLIKLLTKASMSGVKKIVLDPAEYKVIWSSDDGQVALIPKDKYMEGFSLKSCLLNTSNDS